MTMWRIGFVLASACAGCSTLAPLPTPQECESDEDCTVEDEVCAPDTRVCVPGGDIPPLPDLGFDVQELVGGSVVFRAEIAGCDEAIPYAQSKVSLRGVELEQTFELEAFVDEPEDPDMPPSVDDLLVGAIELSQPSRFARAPLVPPRLAYPTIDDSGEVATVLPTTQRWPRYHPYDVLPPVLQSGGFVLWRTIPTEGAPVLQMIVPPQTVDDAVDDPESCTLDTDCCDVDATGTACEPDDPNFCLPGVGRCTAIGNPRFRFTFKAEDRCARELQGRVVKVDGETLERRGGISGVPLTVRHADTSGPDIPRLGVHAIDETEIDDRPLQCTSDAGCIAGEQFCDGETNQCVLALAGRPADNGSTVTEEDVVEPPGVDPVDTTGNFAANIYTYCESNPNNVGFVRSFTVSAAPSGPLAALSYTFDASIGPLGAGDLKPVAEVTKDLCVPDWGESVPLSLQLVGDPVALLGAGTDAFVCCDVGCLPASREAADVGPTQASSCDGRTVTAAGDALTATVSATLTLDAADLDAWDEADCHPPDADENGVVGGIRRKMDCSAASVDATCVAPDLAAGKDGTPRDYVLRLESPQGSLFQSQIVTLAVQASGEPQELELLPRVLVRGRVVLDSAACVEAAPPDGDCGSEGAVIRAERLRMPDETDVTAVGPYVHEVPTFYNPITERQGEYFLPLDPGVYLLTALPLSGSRGGPAAITIIDLTGDITELEHDLVLASGVLVTLDLNGFDPRAQILPIDRGSWRDLPHPGRLEDPDLAKRTVDLNAIGECLQSADEVPQACRIRRLISGQSLSASQVGQVRFTARADADAGTCD